MKKVKPWMLTLGSLVVASTTVATLATTFGAVVQEQYKISDNNQTRSSGLPTPRAIDNNTIKSDWSSYTKETNKEAKVYAQHNYIQEWQWWYNDVGQFTSMLLNYNKSAKSFTTIDSINHNDSEKINTFQYGRANNNDLLNKWNNVVKNALHSIRSKSSNGWKNHIPLMGANKWSGQNNSSGQFLNFEKDGEAEGGYNSYKEEQFWVQPYAGSDARMVRNLPAGNRSIFGQIAAHSNTARHMLYGTSINPGNAQVQTGNWRQVETSDYVTENDSKWNDILNLVTTKVSNYVRGLGSVNITGDDDLYYNESRFGLPNNMFETAEEYKWTNGDRKNFISKSNIRLFDATNLSNGGAGDEYTHTSWKFGEPSNYQQSTRKSQRDWFEGIGDWYGYNQNLTFKGSNMDPVWGSLNSTNNTAINMDIKLENFVSVQALTNHKDNGDVNTMNGSDWPSVQLGWNQTRMQDYKNQTLFAEYFSALANHIQNVEFQRNADANSLANYYALATDIYNENIDVQDAYDIVNQIVLNPENTHFYYTKALTKNANEQEVNATNLDDMTKAIVSKTYGYYKVLPQFFSNDIYATVVHKNGNRETTEWNKKIYDGRSKTWETIHYNDGQGKPWETFDNYVSTTIKDLKMVDGNDVNAPVLANQNTRSLSGHWVETVWKTRDTQSNFKYNANNHQVDRDGGNGIKFTWKWNKELHNKLFSDANFAANGIKLEHTPSSVFDSNKQNTNYVDKTALINKTKTAIGIDKIGKNINEGSSFNASDHNNGQLNDSLTKSKEFYNELTKANPDLTKRTQEYYNAKKALDTQKMIHFNVDTNNVPLQYWFKEKTYQDATTNQIITKKDNKDTSHFIKYSFDYDYLKLNDLQKYLEVTFDTANQIATIKVKLDAMKQAIGNWDNLTTKAKVFDNNGLHEYFNETFDNFWNKVLEITNQTPGVTTTKLKASDFKNTVKYTTKSNKSTRDNQLIKDILEHGENAFGGTGANKKGWVDPIDQNPNELIYKFSVTTPKYQDGNNLFENRMNVTVAQQDELTNTQIANTEYTQKNNDLNSVKTEQESISNQITETTSKLKDHLKTINNAQIAWNGWIDSVLGTPDEPGNGSAAFKQKFKEITESGDAQIEALIRKSEQVYKETLGKFEEEMQIYRPFNWMWLVAKSEITQEQVDKYNAEFTNKILDIEQKTSQALTDLLALKDPAIKKEFNDKRDELYKTLQSTLNQYKDTLTKLQNPITEQKTKNTEIKNWMNANKNYQDTIQAELDVTNNANSIQLYAFQKVNENASWISKSERWWSMYNPNGSVDPTNPNNQTKYLFDKDKLLNDINKKFIIDIKTTDNDFAIDETNSNNKIVTLQLLEKLISSKNGSNEFTGDDITLGSGNNKYIITPKISFTVDTNDHNKINNLKFSITAQNQFIKQTNEKIAALENQINTNETSLNQSEQTVNTLLTGNEEHSVAKLEALINKIISTTVEQDVAAKNHAYNWTNTSKPSELKVGSYYHQKLNPLFIITMSVLLVVLLILLILLLVWLKKSNYRYRYVV